MKDFLIKEYINHLTTNEIKEFAKKVGITKMKKPYYL